MRKTWTKRLLSTFVAAMMGLSLLPAGALAAQPNDWNVDAEAKTVSVYTAAGLREWADSVEERNNQYDGYTISIENDIDLSGENWTSIISLGGDVTIDGKNHTISNMRISERANGSDGNTYLGFIGNLNYNTVLTVQDITFENAHVQDPGGDAEYSWCGVVVGHGPMDGVDESQAECTFTNVNVVNSVVTGGHNNGGIMGYSCSTEKGILFENCSVTNTFVGGYNSTSGILFGMGIANVTVRDCSANGVILYTDGLNFNCSQSWNEQLWLGNVYPYEIYGDRYGSNGTATYKGTNNWGSSYVAYPVIYHYADGDVQEYVQVNVPLSGAWYADANHTQPVTQITADLTDSDMYPYNTESIANEQAYATQDVTRVANPLTHGAIELYTTANVPDKTSYPGLQKTILMEDGTQVEADDVAVKDQVTFRLESNVPEDLSNYVTYTPDEPEIVPNSIGTADEYILTFHDEMAEQFTAPTEVTVTIGDTTLTQEQYTYTTDPEDTCTFEITLDLAALYNNDVITENDFGTTPIVVTYKAALKEGTTAGKYLNTAWVSYPEGTSVKDTVTVNTYGISIFKYDQSNPEQGLSGAEFLLYQQTTEGGMIEDSQVTVSSGEDGIARFDGLDAGTYYLKETKAPEGYVASSEILTITIPEDADGTTNVVSVQFANSPIPHTGGMGTAMFTVGGAAILAAAGALFVVSRRKETR